MKGARKATVKGRLRKESEKESLKAGLRSAPRLSCAGLWLPLPTADTGKRGHSCIKLLIFVSSTSVSDSAGRLLWEHFFIKTKAQMMIRKETQSTTIQIMRYVLLGSSQMGRFISFSTWQALVVTELTPEHHSTEKSQGWFTTYKLTEMLSWRYSLISSELMSW